MIRWLVYLGWDICNATTFRDDVGEDVRILYGSPALAKCVFVASFFRRLRKRAVAVEQWHEPLERALASSKTSSLKTLAPQVV